MFVQSTTGGHLLDTAAKVSGTPVHHPAFSHQYIRYTLIFVIPKLACVGTALDSEGSGHEGEDLSSAVKDHHVNHHSSLHRLC